ncbi:unnamed protein product [Musa acuminata subsp. burmannicoides]
MRDPSSLRVTACGHLLGSHRRNASLPIGKITITDRITRRRREARKKNGGTVGTVSISRSSTPLEFLGEGSPADPSPSRGNPGGALAMEPLGPSVSTLGLPDPLKLQLHVLPRQRKLVNRNESSRIKISCLPMAQLVELVHFL